MRSQTRLRMARSARKRPDVKPHPVASFDRAPFTLPTIGRKVTTAKRSSRGRNTPKESPLVIGQRRQAQLRGSLVQLFPG
jgi:hypothetical protein